VTETARRLVIQGRVQGVWFRGWMKKDADASGIRGWVRNRRDGTVEAVIAGGATEIGRFVEKCRAGPPLARVAEIVVTPVEQPKGEGFETRPTE
jgi:acylphosphatase